MIDVRFNAMTTWPHGQTSSRRGRHTFKAGWQNTLWYLEKELRQLEAENVVIGVQMLSRHIRQDGWPRGDAPDPGHPGIEISFDSPAVARLDPVVREGLRLIRVAGGIQQARMKHHPDHGGAPEAMVAINAATDPSAKRLIYATDCCVFWQHNVRSIALGLESLRAVDRYGITRRGEQYAGFRAALTA